MDSDGSDDWGNNGGGNMSDMVNSVTISESQTVSEAKTEMAGGGGGDEADESEESLQRKFRMEKWFGKRKQGSLQSR